MVRIILQIKFRPYFELVYSYKIAYFTALEAELSIPMNYVTT